MPYRCREIGFADRESRAPSSGSNPRAPGERGGRGGQSEDGEPLGLGRSWAEQVGESRSGERGPGVLPSSAGVGTGVRSPSGTNVPQNRARRCGAQRFFNQRTQNTVVVRVQRRDGQIQTIIDTGKQW